MAAFAVRNFGCRANQAESFAWAEAIRERGLRLEEDWVRSDLVVVNSCTLTGRADRDVRKLIRTIARVSPSTAIVVTGCYAERAPAEVAGLPNVVAVLANRDKDGLADCVVELAGRRPAPPRPGIEGTADAENVNEEVSFRARATLKAQDGCDDRCAFCVIPSVRGRSRSVPPDEIVAAVGRLSGRGFNEIVLAGIHLSSYGEDLEPRRSLLDLLRAIEGVPGPPRVRLTSLDPRRTGAELIAHITASARIAPHFHLSLQHASARLLRLMGRAVEADAYDGVLDELARRAPDAALGADVMVGFPGETEADFEELRAFLDRSPLTYYHVFPYSPRPGTPAATRPQLSAGVVTARAKTLRRLSTGKDFLFRRRFLGRELDAVVIDRSERGGEVLTGNGIRVLVPPSRARERELVRVAIRRVLPRRTEGEVVV